MNVLVVDDEAIAVQGLVDGINWDELPVDGVYTAGSMSQAIEAMRESKIDVLICDIEMPGGNGLDLIEWVNEHHPEIISIILSCHDEFRFAQQAIRLRCMDYALKPADPEILGELLKKAARLLLDSGRERQYMEYGRALLASSADGAGAEATVADTVEKAKNYISQHIDEDLTVAGLADMFHFSPDHFSRVFKKEVGKSITDYINECRVLLAAGFLRDTKLPLALIPERVGFESYSYFTKRFRQYFAMSPKEYRKREG